MNDKPGLTGHPTWNVQKKTLPHPPATCQGGPIHTSLYKTSQVRKERFKKSGICKSAPQRYSASNSEVDTKSCSVTDLLGSSKSSLDSSLTPINHDSSQHSDHDPIFLYIQSARKSIRLETKPMQESVGPCAHHALRESLVVSSGPIASIKDLHLLSKRLSSLYTERNRIIDEPVKGNEAKLGSGFAYALQREDKKRCNTYNLYFTKQDKAKAHGNFYTVSAYSVSEIDENGAMESISSQRWLWERDIFNKISTFPYFRNFTIQRAFKAWHRFICTNKRTRHLKLLRTNLFSADVFLQKAILHIQALCESASSSATSHYLDSGKWTSGREISLIQLSDGVTYTLHEFVYQQDKAMLRAKEELTTLRREIITVIVSACQEISDKEQIHGLCRDHSTPSAAPAHAKVLHWRGIHNRLKQFVTLCGNIVLQLLQRLVLKAVATLLFVVERSISQAKSQVSSQDEAFQKMREQVVSHPYMTMILDRLESSLEVDQDREILDHFKFGFLKVSSFDSFLSPTEPGLGYLSEVAETDILTLSDTIPSVVLLDDPSNFNASVKKSVTPVLPLWEVRLYIENQIPSSDIHVSNEVTFTPTAMEFHSTLVSVLSLYEEVLKGFESLATDDQLKPFLSYSKYDLLMVLEEESSQGQQHPETSWFDCHSLLHNYIPYQQQVKQLKKCLSCTMLEVKRKFNHFSCFCMMVGLCKRIDIASSLSQEVWTVPMYQKAFALYHDQVHAMEGMVTSFHVGAVEAKVDTFQQVCLEYPQTILKELKVQLPRTATAKCDQLICEIKVATKKLVKTPSNVHTYVSYLNDVDNVTTMIPLFEKRLLNITSMYNVVHQFHVEVTSEEMALYKLIIPQFMELKNVLIEAQASKFETVHQYISDLRKLVTDVVNQAIKIKTEIIYFDTSEELSSEECSEKLDKCLMKLNDLRSQANCYVEYHDVLGVIPSTAGQFRTFRTSVQPWTPEEVYDEVMGISESGQARKDLFHIQLEWKSKLKQWNSIPLASLNISNLQKEVNGLINQLDSLENELSSSNKILSSLQTEVAEFRSWIPTLSCLLSPALKIRHWDIICKAIGIDTPLSAAGSQSVTINNLQELKVFEYQSTISKVSYEANHEAALDNMLKKVSGHWLSRELILLSVKGIGERPTFILGGVEDLLTSLEDSLLTISTIKSSRHVSPIKHSVLDWQQRLIHVMQTVECWIHCQKNWVYLKTIFTSVDIQRQLFSEAQLFLEADRSWRDVLRVVAEKSTVLKATTNPGVLEAFQACNVLLEEVFKSLQDFLEAKRTGYGRLYFISDEELLDLLSHTKEPLTVQPYLSKLFTNIKLLDADVTNPVSATVHGIVSIEDERVQLHKNVHARGPPEKWLSSLDVTSKETVRRLIENGISTYKRDQRIEWCLNQLGQVSLAVALVIWTGEAETCLKSETPQEQLKQLYQTWNQHIHDLIRSCNNEDVPSLKHVVLTSLLTLDVHCRDISQWLFREGVTNTHDFQWTKQLRYYWDDSKHCLYLDQCCAKFPYGNEYIGCLPRLVVTPLTERCYLTLTTALHVNLGGLLLGPAGTGKSESVKDLAKAMGRFCLLMNCSESLDYKIIGCLLTGLCYTGTWCCFDEFNRISVEVLSVVGQQLKYIKEAKDRKAIRFLFDGREIKLDANCGTFITLNPSCGGRVELPDNVRLSYRPVAMIVPDTAIIAEVLLLGSGFTTAKRLATKLDMLYKLTETQVSKQAHYDFGLRGVKAVILAGKSHLQKIKRSKPEIPVGDVETSSLVQAILGFNLSQLKSTDMAVMRMLLKNLFGSDNYIPEDTLKAQDLLKDHLENAARKHGLQISSPQLHMCSQLYNTLLIRHGVMVIGQTGTGKTTVINLLKAALNIAHESTICEMEYVNPKSVTIDELYGYFNEGTFQWKAGILPMILKRFCDQLTTTPISKESSRTKSGSSVTSCVENSAVIEKSEKKHEDNVFTSSTDLKNLCCPFSPHVSWNWIVLDGPVDPIWIENLNSVLDESKLLCLSNNERIRLQPGIRLLFETDSLKNASPATVSRCGMIYMDTQLLCWRQFVDSWINKLPQAYFSDKCKEYIKALFNQSIKDGNLFLEVNKSDLMCPLPSIGAVRTLCSLLQSLFEQTIKHCPELFQEDEKLLTRKEETGSPSNIGVQTLTAIYIPKAVKNEMNLSDHTAKPHLRKKLQMIGKLFVFSFTWAYGGCFEHEDGNDGVSDINTYPSYYTTCEKISVRSKFDALVRKLFSCKGSVAYIHLPASADLMFSYYVDINNCSFVQWKTLLPTPTAFAMKISLMQKGFANIHDTYFSPFYDESSFQDMKVMATSVPLIPTINTVQLTYLSCLLNKTLTSSVMFVGKVGIGKTQILQHLYKVMLSDEKCSEVLFPQSEAERRKKASISTKRMASVIDSRDDDEEQTSLVYNLSRQTTSAKLQSAFENCLMRTSFSVLKPSIGEKLMAFLDDLNISSVDQYGSYSCSELLRQLLDNGGWYDRKNLMYKEVHGVRVVSTCRSKGWGYADLSERCLSKFSSFGVPEPLAEDLHSVFVAHVTTAFSFGKFSHEVTEAIANLVSCAIFVFQEMKIQLKPSPSKPQYTFCVRDLTKVFSRLLNVNHRVLKTAEDAVRLLVHELFRVFKDRSYPEDRDSILHIISEGLRINFKMVKSVQDLKEHVHIYEDFTTSLGGYSMLKNPKKLVKYLERTQNQINLTEDKNSQMSFFPQVCEHITRMTRVLKQPRGHLLLIGVGGVGKRSCAHLSAFISKCDCHCLVPDSNFLDTIKDVVIQCGVNQQSNCLLVSENLGSAQPQADLLCALYELVTGGELSSLFSNDEVESILNQMSVVVGIENGFEYRVSSKDLWRLFVERVHNYLHVILCGSPASPLLTEIQKKYQGIFTHSTIDFVDEWNSKALYGVAVREILTCDAVKSDIQLKEYINQLAMSSVKIHGTVLSALSKEKKHATLSFTVTPVSFIRFIQTFCEMLLERYTNCMEKRSHLRAGLNQLEQTNQIVGRMKTELSLLQPEVECKAQEVESILHKLITEQEEVNLLRSTVSEEQAMIETESKQVVILQEEAEKDLLVVLPAMTEAEHGLSSLKKSDLQEIRSYGSPPQMVVHVMSAVCLLLQQPTDWSTAKHLMTDPTAFLRTLSLYDKENIPDKVLTKLKKYTSDPDFNPVKVAHYSIACQSFCQWILAVEKYGKMHRIIAPKRKNIMEIRQKLELVKSKLETKQRQLEKLKERMVVLKQQHVARVQERDTLQLKCNEISMKLRRAQNVTISLKDEQVRWSKTLSLLDSRSATMFGDTLLSTACLIYLGPFTAQSRSALLNKWKELCLENKISLNTSFKMNEAIGDLQQIQQWYQHGLPKDQHSVQCALITTISSITPFIVDPQGQANSFLKSLLQSLGLKILNFTSAHLVTDIQECVTAGLPVLIEDAVEHLNSQLEPFLVRQIEIRDGQQLLKVGKTEIEYNPSFRLFLACPKTNASIGSEVCNKTTLVNFTSSSEGLQDQLLSIVIKLKEPELDSTHSQLAQTISNDKTQLNELEKKMLDILRTSKGNVLDDEEVIQVLKQIKEVTTEVKDRLEKAQQTEIKIMALRGKYLSVAIRGTILYDEIQSLRSLSPLYQFSMQWFQRVFSKCLENIQSEAATDSVPDKDHFQSYLSFLVDNITSTVLEKTLIALSCDHCIPFIFKLCCSIHKMVDGNPEGRKQVSSDEWKAMINVAYMVTSNNRILKDKESDIAESKASERQSASRTCKPNFLSQDSWDSIGYLEETLCCFTGLRQDCLENQQQWHIYVNCSNPFEFQFKEATSHTEATEILSGSCENAEIHVKQDQLFKPSLLSPFQKLLLTQVLRPDYFISATQSYIASVLGIQYCEKPPLSLKNLLKSTSHVHPILFILSEDKDPYFLLRDHIKMELGKDGCLESISFGKGQEEKVMSVLYAATARGNWVLLENCHSSVPGITAVENFLKWLQTDPLLHPSFRLYLTCKPASDLPLVLLTLCVKVYLDSSKFMYSSMKQLISVERSGGITEEMFEGGSNTPMFWKVLVYRLCLFHSAINGSKVLEALGWRLPYKFKVADLQVSICLLIDILSVYGSKAVCWSTVYSLVGEVCYGGRVTNFQDKMCLISLLSLYCNEGTFHSDDLKGSETTNFTTMDGVSPSMSYSALCAKVGQLSVKDEPRLIGWNQKINNSSQTEETMLYLLSLHTMSLANKIPGIQTKHNDEQFLEKMADIQERLSTIETVMGDELDIECVTDSYVAPLLAMFTRELSQWNHRVCFVLECVKVLVSAVKGEEELSSELEKTYLDVVVNKIPETWNFENGVDLSLSQWLDYVKKNISYMLKLGAKLKHAPNDAILPKKYYLPAFASPQGFFTTVKQYFSMKASIPIEEINLAMTLHSCLETNSHFCTNVPTVTISGLSIGGASLDKKGFLTMSDKTDLYQFPDILCYPTRIDSDNLEDTFSKVSSGNMYRCPVYTSINRHTYVTSIGLPTSEQPMKWNLERVALFITKTHEHW